MILGVALLLMLQLISPLNPAYAGVVTPPITRCNIEIGDAHISDNLLRTRALIAVKVNASSKCDKPIQGLVLTVELYKVGLLINHQVAMKRVSINGVVSQNRVIKNQKTYVKCRSNKWTKFYGIAYAEAKVNGKSMKTYRVRSENIERLQCGN
jgi:frataxin-like iron-binding protein CyaY